jgi:hypothetical protein
MGDILATILPGFECNGKAPLPYSVLVWDVWGVDASVRQVLPGWGLGFR